MDSQHFNLTVTTDDSPAVSVIMTTFRSPNYLRQVLRGFANQSQHGFEVVVGEDGQTAETRSVIGEFEDEPAFRVRYVSQAHEGFGKTKILNRAITAAEGDYLVFTDGDCIPNLDFVAQHTRLASPGKFLSGGCFRLPRPITERILAGSVPHGDLVRPSWLRENEVDVPAKWMLIQRHAWVARVLDLATTTRPTFNGHNASAWKSDLIKANGFNLEMKYGGLDRELGERLENAGVVGTQIRHRAVCFHLDHDRGYVTEADWKRNREIRKRVRREGITEAKRGLREVTTSDDIENVA